MISGRARSRRSRPYAVGFDDGKLDLGFEKDTQPDEMARVVSHIIAACRVVVPPGGVYR